MIRRSYIFSGRVQGVGFRMTAWNLARRYAVSGWVRNEPYGTVRLEAQGEPGEVDRYIDDLRRAMEGCISGESVSEMTPAEMSEEEGLVIAH